ncbi:MAG: hypothetical protein GY708_15960 [Actinomycetia bacterium]|nr:hypothetical protein [Actinomycetes bacterium]
MARYDVHPAVARILSVEGNRDLLDTLVDLPGSDFRSFMLEVAARRAEVVEPTQLVHQYTTDRFVAPGEVDPVRLAGLEAMALEAVEHEFEPIQLSPLVPAGIHRSIGGISQDSVVTTVRSTEVAADPTTALALEAARRRIAMSVEERRVPIQLAGISRVTRGQKFDGPRSFSHFSILGVATAGRAQASLDFEVDALVHHVATMAQVVERWGVDGVEALISDFADGDVSVAEVVVERLNSAGVTAEIDDERTAGRGYYDNLCFKLHAVDGGQKIEFGDGGVVDWTQQLLADRKERFVASGIGLDRLAMFGMTDD